MEYGKVYLLTNPVVAGACEDWHDHTGGYRKEIEGGRELPNALPMKYSAVNVIHCKH